MDPVPNETEEEGANVIEPESVSDHSAQPINALAADTIKSLQMTARVHPSTPSSSIVMPCRIAAALYQNRRVLESFISQRVLSDPRQEWDNCSVTILVVPEQPTIAIEKEGSRLVLDGPNAWACEGVNREHDRSMWVVKRIERCAAMGLIRRAMRLTQYVLI
jgi:hypothetical protein